MGVWGTIIQTIYWSRRLVSLVLFSNLWPHDTLCGRLWRHKRPHNTLWDQTIKNIYLIWEGGYFSKLNSMEIWFCSQINAKELIAGNLKHKTKQNKTKQKSPGKQADKKVLVNTTARNYSEIKFPPNLNYGKGVNETGPVLLEQLENSRG